MCVGALGGSIEPPKLKQLQSKTCKNIKGTQTFLKFLKAHNQVTKLLKHTELLKHTDFASEWRKSRVSEDFSGGGYHRTPSPRNLDPRQY